MDVTVASTEEVPDAFETSTLREVPKEWFDRAEVLIPLVQRRFPEFRKMNRSAVLRVAIRKGLDQLEQELAEEKKG
ncbi:MAG: hypothetical protein HY791_02805 [Deltaproteobacteria bacterium]|nr:hypothetical protein [Deltaproteobacteria bacterium]